ncbi:MAG: hypothetical protein KF857_02755 [Fimbriimonadaceae bacterium]|nr:hypothetical protein [Fimbriimonadaceae bacterium]
MPHLQLEVTEGLPEVADLTSVLRELADALGAMETVEPKAVKAYAHVRDTWAMGRGASPGFVHLTVCVLSGRPLDLRRQMADRLYEVLAGHFSRSLAGGLASLTLEVREMDRETYRKG